MDKRIIINEKVLRHFFKAGKAKTLHMYAVMSYMTANYGYISKKDFLQNINDYADIRQRTARRWLDTLIEEGFVHVRKGVIYVKGRRKMEQASVGQPNRMYLGFTIVELEFYSSFRDYAIRSLGLLKQNRFKYYIKKTQKGKNYSRSVYTAKNVEAELPKIKCRAESGVSLSQLEKFIGVDRMTISRAMQGFWEPQVNCTRRIPGRIARAQYRTLLNSIAGSYIAGGLSKGKQFRNPHIRNKAARKNYYNWRFDYDAGKDTYIFKVTTCHKIDHEFDCVGRFSRKSQFIPAQPAKKSWLEELLQAM